MDGGGVKGQDRMTRREMDPGTSAIDRKSPLQSTSFASTSRSRTELNVYLTKVAKCVSDQG